jgi:hypothetical protein
MIDDKYAPTEVRPRYPRPPAPARGPIQPSPMAAPSTHLQYQPGMVAVPTPHPVDVRPVRRSTSHRARTKPRWWETWSAGYGLGIATGAVAMFAWLLLMRLVSA